MKSILDHQDELKAMPEFQLIEKIRHFSLSLEIFNGNFHDLNEFINTHNDPIKSINLRGVNNREILFAFQRQVIRLLHNYISSAISLIDHTRVHYKDLYEKNDKFPEYQNEIDNKFVNNELASFIKGLRHYSIHYRTPGVYTSTSYTMNSLTVSLRLRNKDLLTFTGWSAPARKFIDASIADIDLGEVINSYHLLINDFYQWFQNRQLQIHSSEILIVNKKKDEIAKISIPHILDAQLSLPNINIEQFEAALRFFFHTNDLEKLSNFNIQERCIKIIQMLESRVVLEQSIKTKIGTLYKI